MLSRHFVDNWAAGANSFAENPPNAVLSYAEPAERLPEDAVVVIQDPHLDGDALTYSIKLLDGTIPTATGPCALFIDPFGRPLSPVSAAGCTGARAVAGADSSPVCACPEKMLAGHRVPQGSKFAFGAKSLHSCQPPSRRPTDSPRPA